MADRPPDDPKATAPHLTSAGPWLNSTGDAPVPTFVPGPAAGANRTASVPRLVPADLETGTHLLVWRQLRRLVLLLLVLGGTGSAVKVVGFFLSAGPRVDPALRWSFFGSLIAGYLLLAGVGVYVLRRSPPPLAGLRRAEVVMFGTIAVILAANQYVLNRSGEFARYVRFGPDAVSYRALGLSVQWVIVIVLYGMFIPNTGRRCALVTGGMAVAGIAATAASVSGASSNNEAITIAIGVMVYTMLGAVAIAVYGSHRIATHRQEAAEARRLGPYRLVRRLGAGGMGEVHLAEHHLLKRPCAVKLIRPERAGDETLVRRFEREVQAATRLAHPAAVQVYDYGRADDGTFYYVMEYLPGLTLDEVVGKTGPLPAGRAVRVLRQLCGALAEAHALGLVHRDVKPGNIMLCRIGGRPDAAKLLDFGLVTAGDPEDDRLTHAGGIMGTPAYMSPEQARGADAGPPADLYAVGAVAYFLLTGRPPFAGNPLELLHAHRSAAVTPPSAVARSVPPDLEAVVLRCLAKEPADRFPTAADLDAALAACGSADWTDADADAWWGERGPPASSPDA